MILGYTFYRNWYSKCVGKPYSSCRTPLCRVWHDSTSTMHGYSTKYSTEPPHLHFGTSHPLVIVLTGTQFAQQYFHFCSHLVQTRRAFRQICLGIGNNLVLEMILSLPSTSSVVFFPWISSCAGADISDCIFWLEMCDSTFRKRSRKLRKS